MSELKLDEIYSKTNINGIKQFLIIKKGNITCEAPLYINNYLNIFYLSEQNCVVKFREKYANTKFEL